MMDYNLQIKMTALNQASAKVDAVSDSVDKLDNSTKKSNKSLKNFGKTWESFGSRVNVLGQRMSGAITLPLVMFGKSAIDTAVVVDKAWARFNKIFSGTKEDAEALKKESEELSKKFGINIEDVFGVMGEFNKAGIDSRNVLIDLSKKALETSILFDTDLKSAFEGVKSVMFGFGLNTDDTRDALATINIIGDKTTTSEQDILDVMQKSGGVFKQNSISIRDAAAMTSLLAQSNIKGTIAGNMFKTVISKINDATPKATKEMKNFGIDVSGNAFRTASFVDKLKMLHDKQTEVFSSGNKVKIANYNTAMKDLVGLRQLNRFSILVNKVDQLKDVTDMASDKTKNLEFWNKQLEVVLSSTPKKLDLMNQMYRNQQVILGNKLLPIKMELLKIMTKLIDKFNGLSPGTQDFIIKLGLILAATGPVLVYIGLLTTALGFMGSVMSPVIVKFGIASVMAGGFATVLGGIALSAVIAAINSYNHLQKELEENARLFEKNEKKLDSFQKKVGSLSTKKANDQLQAAIDMGKKYNNQLDETTKRYEGFKGVLHAIEDEMSSIWDKVTSSKFAKKIKEAAKAAGFAEGGIVQAFASGGLVYAANGYLSQGKDTIPAMLSPGEMVLNKSQQTNLFDMLSGRNSVQTAGGPTININVGTMVASRGEQRAFARKIEELISEDKGRY